MTQNRIMYMYVSGEHRVRKAEVTKQYKNNNNKIYNYDSYNEVLFL